METTEVCRLCMQFIYNIPMNILDYQDQIDNIFRTVDVNATLNPKICHMCSMHLRTLYDKKLKFSETIESQSSKVIKEHGSRDTPEILLNIKHEKLCRLCIEGENIQIIAMKDLIDCPIRIALEILSGKELGLIIPICETCISDIKRLGEFIISCQDVEKKVSRAVSCPGTITMYDVLQFCERNKEILNNCSENIKMEPDDEYQNEFKYEPDAIPKEEIKSEITPDYFEISAADTSPHLFCCKLCPFTTKNKYGIKRHRIVHKDPEEIVMFKCEICSFQTKYKKSIEGHIIIHKNPEEVIMNKCLHCPYETKIKRNLVKHMVCHKNPGETRMYACKVCPYEAKYKNALDYHMLSHQNPEESIYYNCQFCPFVTKVKTVLSRHSLTHKNFDEVITFKCEHCSYRAKRRGHLKDHMIIHKDEIEIFRFACDQCPYKSKHKKSLEAHKKNHIDPKEIEMYGCSECSYKTKYKSHVLRHKTVHMERAESDNSKYHKCTQCAYQSKVRGSLQKHMEFHKKPVEVKYFKCEYCTYSSQLKSKLEKHRSSHTEDP